LTLPWTLWCACVLLVVDVVEVDDDDDDDDDDADNDDTLQQTNSINFFRYTGTARVFPAAISTVTCGLEKYVAYTKLQVYENSK